MLAVSAPALALGSAGIIAVGVATGLAAALASAVSYLVSRHHGTRAGGGSLRLLVLAHALMGIASLPLCWWLAPATWPAGGRWLPLMAGSVLCYLGSQAAVFAALKQAAASRVAPLLGLKIVMLAILVSLSPGGQLDGRQWLGVTLSVVAAAMLQRGGGLGAGPLGIVLLACLGFAAADLCIVALIDTLEPGGTGSGEPLSRLRAGGLAMAVTYVTCGLVAAAALLAAPGLRPRDRSDASAAAQYAAAWLGGMAALYACFSLLGVVFASVLQATRGVMAIGIGGLLARAGWHELEERIDAPTFFRRVAAAVLMVVAILLFMLDAG